MIDSSEEEKQFLADEENTETVYRPWYSERFKNLHDVVGYWDVNSGMLKKTVNCSVMHFTVPLCRQK